jgi:putative ABC transport system ATP-binding protein
MLEDPELFLSDKIVTIIISFVMVQSFCIVRMVVEKRSKFLSSQKVRILLRKTRRNAMAVLEVKELTKKYGEGESEVIALDHVSFSVERGEFVAIIGASGSGKSTLMNMIGGIDHPTSGSIIIDGHEIQAMSEDELAIFRRRNLGIVYQFYNLIPTLTAEENIALPWKLDGRKENKERLSEIVNMLGPEKRAKHLPGQMSGGQQQRVSIGRALINEPAFILADEPTGNLDSKTSREILDILKFTNQKYKQTILLVTHDEKIALQANRIITIGDGKIIKDEVMK